MACRQSIAFRTRSRTATAAAAGIGVPRRRQRKSSVIDDVEKGYVEKRPTFSVVGCVAGRTRSRCVGGAVPQSKASNARKTCVSVVLLSSSSSEEEDGDVRCSTCAVSDNGGGRGSSDDAVTGKKDGYGDSSYEEVGFFDDDSRKDRVSGSGGNGSASEELGSNCSGINRKRTVPESPGIAKRTRSHSHWNRVPKKNPGTLTNPMGLEMNRECPRSELAKSNDFLEGESGRQGDEENDGCCGIDDERDEDDDDSNSDEEYHAFSKDGGNHLSEDDAAVRNDNKYDEENGCMDKEFGVREEGEDHAVDGAIGDDDEHNGGSGKENNFSKDGADHVMDDAEVGGESLAGNRKTEQVQFPKSTESKRACALKDDIFFKLLVDSIWSKEEELQEELAPKDKSPTKSAETPKCLKRFPLQFFWVDDKVPEVEEKTGEEKMLDELWAEFDLAMNSRDLGSFISPEVDHGEKQDAPSTETDRFNFCCKGRHQFVLDEEIGIKCILCPFVKLEIRYILPPMVHKPGKSCRKVIVDDEDRTVFDKLQSQVINEDYQCSIPSEGTVWDIIPGVKKTLYPHQQEGFEFIWKNLAGSIQLEQMKESNPDEVGGCVISHAPGTGKTRLAILFIKTFMAAFPQCRPIILAPYSMLLTWENEFSKWKVNIPFHILNKSEFSGKEDRAALRLGHKKCRKWVRLVKIFSWNKGNSILGLTYNLFERLVGKSSIHDKEYAEMSKILTEKTGLLVLDEGHKPRNDRTLIWKALEKVKTNRRIILSGTPFQNNLGELYNTLCLVRPQFAQKFISKNGYMCQRRLEMHSDNAQALQGRRDAREGWASLTKEQSFDANLEKLRSMMDPFVHVYKGSILNNLPGLRECILVLHPFPLQKRILDRISNGNYGNNFYHEYITSIISVHPSLLLESNLYGKAGLIIEKEQLESLRLNPYEGVKTKFVLELIRLVKSTSEKVLIFSQYIAPLTLLKEQLKYLFDWTVGKELLQMDGEVADINSRQSSIDCFNDPTSEARVLLASTRACGEGINLIGASRVVLLDVVWNPSVKRQAISRAYRLGQEKVVYTYHLITSETIEGDKYHRQSEKDRLCGLLFSSTDGRTQRQHASSKISEDRILTLEEMVRHDRILEEMVGHEKLKGMFKRP